jgi:hypothetical protein
MIGSPLLFVRGDARAKSNRSREVHRLILACFLYAVMRMLKIIEAERYIDR